MNFKKTVTYFFLSVIALSFCIGAKIYLYPFINPARENLDMNGYTLTNVGGISGNSTYISVGGEVTSHALTGKGDIVCDKFEANGYVYLDLLTTIPVGGGIYSYGYILCHGSAQFKANNDVEYIYGSNGNFFGGYNLSTNKLRFGTGSNCTTNANVAFEINSSMNCKVVNNLAVGKAISLGYEVLSDSGTITISSGTVINCTKDGIMSVTLPTAVGNQGLYFKIKKSGTAGAVSLLTNAAETIDGTDDPIYVDAKYDFLGIVSDNANWIVVDRYIQ